MRGPGAGCRCAAAAVTALVSATALALAFAWPQIFDAILSTQMVISPGSPAYKEWLSPSVPIYFDVSMFNWTNADKFPNATPHVQELGPYRFREERYRVNITWHANNASVGYRTFRRWHFDPDISNGSLDDIIVMPNVVAASAVYRSRLWGYMRQATVSMGLNVYNQGIHVRKKVRELLFEGYPDDMLVMAKTLPRSMTGGAPPVERFGWFYQRNNSIDTDGYMEVSTGTEPDMPPGQLLKWNHLERLKHYDGFCAKVEGTAGEFIPRNLTPDSHFVTFVADLCRPLRLPYAGSGVLGGLPYYKYAVTEETFDNSTYSHDNACFCNGECSWYGLMNVSACRYGAPAFISLPHFLHGDPGLRVQVTGLHPDPEKHSFYFSIEPKLGIPLDVAARFQLNVLMQPNKNIELYEKVPELIFPILWVEQHVVIPEKMLSELRLVRSILDWGGVGCAVIALLLGTCLAVATCVSYCRKRPPAYTPAPDLTKPEKIKEEEMKLNPM